MSSTDKPAPKRKRASGGSDRGKKNSHKIKKIHVDVDSISADTRAALAQAGARTDKLIRSPRALVHSMQRMLRHEYPGRAVGASELEGWTQADARGEPAPEERA